MRQRLFVLASLIGLGLAAPASAQDDGEFDNITENEGEETPPETTETTETAPETAPETSTSEPMMATAEGGSDHQLTVGHWGAEVVALAIGGFTPQTPAVIPMLGVRKWTSETSGWEAGVALAFISDGGDPAQTTLWAGGSFGFMKTLGVMKHMVVFWEPQGTLLIVVPNDGIDGTDDQTVFVLDGRFNLGTEVRLGMVGLPHLGMTARISAGLQMLAAENTAFFIGTQGGLQNSVRGLLEGDVGFVFYW
jgi:hypothetical protein